MSRNSPRVHRGTGPRRPSAARDNGHVRRLLCEEAARIITEDGIRDFAMAKRKAAARLAVAEGRKLPSNREIEDAVHERLQLFARAEVIDRQRERYDVALEAMSFLDGFRPRLVGALLSGAVTEQAPVELHLFADTPEELSLHLERHGIPFQSFDRRLRFSGDRVSDVPGVRFRAGDVPVELLLFPPRGLREAPLSPVDGRPMRRAPRKEVEQLAGVARGRDDRGAR